MKSMISEKTLRNLAQQVQLHNEVLSEMQNQWSRLHHSGNRIGKEMGAIAYRANVSSGWATFVMPDMSIRFGTISSPCSKSEIVVDVSDLKVFGNDEKVAFEEAEQNFKEFFKVKTHENDLSTYYAVQ